MTQRLLCSLFPVRHCITSVWYNDYIVRSIRYVTVHRHYDTTSALFVLSGTSQYNLTMIQRVHCLFYPYVTVHRHYDTTSTLFVLSGTSQYNLTMIQRLHCLFYPVRHSTPHYDTTSALFVLSGTSQYTSLWYNVYIVCSIRYVTVHRHYYKTSTLFVLSGTSQYNLTMIQRLQCVFYPVRHSTQSLWYNVCIVRSIRYVTVHRHYDITSALFVLSGTSQYKLTMIQRLHCSFYPLRHSTSSIWYNVCIVRSCRYVTVQRHYDTTSVLFVLSGTSQYTVTLKQRLHGCSFRYVTVQPHYDTTSALFVLSGTSQYNLTMIQRLHCLFFPVRLSTPSLWYNVYIVCSFRYVTVQRQYDTTSALFVLSGTSQYNLTRIQRLHCPFFPVRHSTSSIWYNVYIVCSLRYVTVQRQYDTTSELFVLSGTWQYNLTMIQRLHCPFFPVRHSTSSLWYNVHIVCSIRYVKVHRHYDTTSSLFVLSGTSQYNLTKIQRLHCLFYPVRHSTSHYDTTSTVFVLSGPSQYNVTVIQRLHCLFFPVRHSTSSLWYIVCRICSIRYVTVHRHYYTTSTLFVLSGTSQYTVTMTQRLNWSFFPVRHITPSQWYNVCIVRYFRYVTVQRHYDTTSTLFVLSGTSQYIVTMIQRLHCSFLTVHHSTTNVNIGSSMDWVKLGLYIYMSYTEMLDIALSCALPRFLWI